ncbi:amidohydrolase family protein [Nocardioides cheoyonin]|uniref:amidohydrolase family protein n=1 Tax=Nocardioides cheoyonin TaxID=3156615 RepID=UPI0032B58B51
MSSIDVHAHHVGADLVARLQADGAAHAIALTTDDPPRVRVGSRMTGLPLLPGLTDVAARLAWLDRAGIEKQLIAPWMDLAGYHLPIEDAAWFAAAQNDALANLVADHPDRFIAAAAVPLQDAHAAADEAQRAIRGLGHRAVQIGARIGETGLDDPILEPFWNTIEELDVPLIIHPMELEVPQRHRRLFLHILVGNPSETTFAAAALLLGGVLERHPRLRVLLVHGGGFLPYQLGRIDRGLERAPHASRGPAQQPPRQTANRLFYDTVLHNPDELRHLEAFAQPGHLLLGSDYPFPMRLDDPLAAAGAAAIDTTQLGRAAEEWLGLTPASQTTPPSQGHDEGSIA